MLKVNVSEKIKTFLKNIAVAEKMSGKLVKFSVTYRIEFIVANFLYEIYLLNVSSFLF